MAADTFALFAVAAPGLEAIVARELAALGMAAATPEDGGVTFAGGLEQVGRANLHLRTASRVVARIGRFHARALGELERRARTLPWERFIAPGAAVRLRVTCRKSRLYHERAVAERIAGAIAARTGAGIIGAAAEDDEGEDAQLFVIRFLRDDCTVSADTSGALLHRRGYRLAGGKAPMRETLAAAALLAAGWDGSVPLLDPFCGSGTIPIEAALLARRIAPGLRRSFGFLHWPDADPALWRRVTEEAEGLALPRTPAAIRGSDRDAGAIEAAQANAERAGVAADIALDRRAVSAVEPAGARGWVVTNPPYGKRVGERNPLRDLYASLGNVLRRRAPGWQVALIAPPAPLERATGLPFSELLRTTNGGIPVRLLAARVPSETGGEPSA